MQAFAAILMTLRLEGSVPERVQKICDKSDRSWSGDFDLNSSQFDSRFNESDASSDVWLVTPPGYVFMDESISPEEGGFAFVDCVSSYLHHGSGWLGGLQ